ncbi:efflux transporter periplasmic adaptor subunit [Longibacter salinarum]|uniref:Efflux transporter periplasmic adaptor subunit n=1 Tax=Longibacter salinarum TaxID=1850348 RepID=A0A2A8CYH5_9BACT|nr:efflux RND transporter periplasmic adaptor subunit [Longibacter salinarum]PEN13772.1 efflux transporter periplasmic adaptor subunit [Longibacter salinarum]
MITGRNSTWLVAALLLGASIIGGCGSPDDTDERSRGGRWGGDREGKTPSVEAVQARFGALPLRERMSGTVYARNQVQIYPEISGRVVSVNVENGDRVERGQALLRLESDTYEQRVKQARASLRIARANATSAEATMNELQSQLKRAERLAENQFQSEQQLESLRAQVLGAEADLEQARGQVEQAEATLEERQADLRRTVVRAPISGSVGQRDVQVGQRVGPDTRVYTMGDLNTVRVEVGVTDRMVGRIQPGQTAQITAPSLGDTLISAEVTRISPFISNESFSAEAEIEVPNDGGLLRAGMFVKVDVLYGESQDATIVPLAALYEDPTTGSRGVFVAPTLGTEVPIPSADSYDEDEPPALSAPTPTTFKQVEILAEGQQTAGVRGIEPGDWVVTVGQNLLSTSTDERVDARVRAMPWSRLIALQRLQDTDLLNRIMKRQREAARQKFDTASTEGDSAPDSTDTSARSPMPAATPSAPDSSQLVLTSN